MENIVFDSTNPKFLCELMEKYGDSEYPFCGKNDNGEDTEIHISKMDIIYKTYQNNGWIRVNYFDKNGYLNEESFDGRWK